MVDLTAFDRALDEELLDRLRHDKGASSHWLFVGRLAPNKCQHDVVKAFAVFRHLYDPSARLSLVGGTASDRYRHAVESFVAALGLADSVDLAGSVTPQALATYYRSADVFVCLSEHEGFGIPLLEAMYHGVPVVAFAAAAVPETVGAAALLLPTKAPATVAAAVQRVLSDDVVGRQLSAAGRDRVVCFDLAETRSRWRAVLADVLSA
jgi:glycosyltransferase involved in cell wall biosynthesis